MRFLEHERTASIARETVQRKHPCFHSPMLATRCLGIPELALVRGADDTILWHRFPMLQGVVAIPGSSMWLIARRARALGSRGSIVKEAAPCLDSLVTHQVLAGGRGALAGYTCPRRQRSSPCAVASRQSPRQCDSVVCENYLYNLGPFRRNSCFVGRLRAGSCHHLKLLALLHCG